MYFNPFDHKTAQLALEERIREAQESHANQRRMMQQFAQALNWLGNRLIVCSQDLQTQPQTLDLHAN